MSTPDYRIWLGKREVIVEVKQLEPREFEEELQRSASDPDSAFIPSNIASRIRSKFDNARKQLRGLAKGHHPAMFVLYDATRGLSGLEAEDFLNAIYGEEASLLTTTPDARVTSVEHRFGGKRKLGESYNRSTSAFAWLHGRSGRQAALYIFHNDNADIPLPVSAAAKLAEAQFRRKSGPPNTYRGWERIEAAPD